MVAIFCLDNQKRPIQYYIQIRLFQCKIKTLFITMDSCKTVPMTKCTGQSHSAYYRFTVTLISRIGMCPRSCRSFCRLYRADQIAVFSRDIPSVKKIVYRKKRNTNRKSASRLLFAKGRYSKRHGVRDHFLPFVETCMTLKGGLRYFRLLVMYLRYRR